VLWRDYAAYADGIPRELTSDGNIRVQAVWPDRDCGSGERKPGSNRKTLLDLKSSLGRFAAAVAFLAELGFVGEQPRPMNGSGYKG
jgi:hypothetical protein